MPQGSYGVHPPQFSLSSAPFCECLRGLWQPLGRRWVAPRILFGELFNLVAAPHSSFRDPFFFLGLTDRPFQLMAVAINVPHRCRAIEHLFARLQRVLRISIATSPVLLRNGPRISTSRVDASPPLFTRHSKLHQIMISRRHLRN